MKTSKDVGQSLAEISTNFILLEKPEIFREAASDAKSQNKALFKKLEAVKKLFAELIEQLSVEVSLNEDYLLDLKYIIDDYLNTVNADNEFIAELDDEFEDINFEDTDW